jgi:hypothetical protein
MSACIYSLRSFVQQLVVGSARAYHQIVGTVVVLILVYVMDFCAGWRGMTERGLGQQPVFGHHFTVDAVLPVSGLHVNAKKP